MFASTVNDPSELVKAVGAVFRNGGLLSRMISDYEWRPQQAEMASAVAKALVDRRHLLVEAGTGTGKTLAYLIPAILSRRKLVVSTWTRTLQDQLIQKDLPLLARCLPVGFRAVSLKGKSNYLCRYRFKRFCEEPRFVDRDEVEKFDSVRAWALRTQTGDRSELSDLAEDSPFWRELSVQGDSCLGSECPEFSDCHLMRARQESAAADLVVVNHHLFFADLALKEQRFGQVLPHYDSVIFDEAHQLEETATQYFGVSVSTFRVRELYRDALKELEYARSKAVGLEGVRALLEMIQVSSDRMFSLFNRKGQERYRLASGHFPPRLRPEAESFFLALDNLRRETEAMQPRREGFLQLGERASAIKEDLTLLFGRQSADYVFWCDVREKGVVLSANPLKVADLLQERLFSKGIPVVLTTPTLSTSGGFDYIESRLGVQGAETLILGTPFDFTRQTLLYLPNHLPNPRQSGFLDAVADEILQILRMTRGRALLLFTSWRNLEETHRLLEGKLPFPLLKQGEQPKGALLERFGREPSVLFGTASFWQGVDIPGEALSCVVVDKLPFSPPTDPMVEARLALLEEEGSDPFVAYQLPVAILTLKQGLGRLIRRQGDRGVLAVLDVRLTKKSYGKRFLSDLPPCPQTHRLSDIDAFFAETSSYLNQNR